MYPVFTTMSIYKNSRTYARCCLDKGGSIHAECPKSFHFAVKFEFFPRFDNPIRTSQIPFKLEGILKDFRTMNRFAVKTGQKKRLHISELCNLYHERVSPISRAYHASSPFIRPLFIQSSGKLSEMRKSRRVRAIPAVFPLEVQILPALTLSMSRSIHIAM